MLDKSLGREKCLGRPQGVDGQPEYGSETPNQINGKHFLWLDLLRFFASFSVLIWHYQHFYYSSAGDNHLLIPSEQPFYSLFLLFYRHGHNAVQVFWIISGFVITAVYALKPLGVWSFIVSRFARLYPLHLTTLLTVAALQSVSMFVLGHFQIYPLNDAFHFNLNIFFISGWGFEKGYSFNAPIWSVSVEVAIYAAFIALAGPIRAHNAVAPMMVFLFAALEFFAFPGEVFWRCGIYFYCGASIFLLGNFFAERKHINLRFEGVLIILIMGLMLNFFLDPHETRILSAGALLVITVFYLDKNEVFSNWLAKLRILGDLTYSTYLWHVPLQIFIILLVEITGIDRLIFSSKYFFVCYFIMLYAISFISFTCLERPLRYSIKNVFGGNKEAI